MRRREDPKEFCEADPKAVVAPFFENRIHSE